MARLMKKKGKDVCKQNNVKTGKQIDTTEIVRIKMYYEYISKKFSASVDQI